MNNGRHLVVVFCLSVVGGILPGTAKAQSSAAVVPSSSFRGASSSKAVGLSPGDELTAVGTIEEVVSTHTQGSPRGLRVILAGPQGIIDASVGPYLAADVQESLLVGQPVTLDGVMSIVNGHHYLLVRQMTIGDRQIAVRNERGFLLHPQATGMTRARHNQNASKGDNE
jgi:hypothetical protein